jgi:phage terminase large subunit
MAEKVRRKKHLLAQEAAQESALRNDAPLTFLDVPSLVLNKDHVFSDLYYKQARYKVYWGGRGSAKSWAFAEALIRKAAALPLRILCVREYQSSIKYSSHKLLKDTIVRLGLQDWFTVTGEGITSKTGAEFIFKGLFNNEDGIRSTEGIDIVWCEEAHSISEMSWRSLMPTIRKNESEVWICFNMKTEDDATYRRFVANPRTDSIIHKVNYDSNPYFSKVLQKEMEDDKSLDYHLYEHIWLGFPLKISNSVILSGKYRAETIPELLHKQAERLLFGADFGFAQDPSTLLRMFIINRTLYIEYEAYGTGVELDDMPEFYDSIPDARSWPIKADCARPETISYLRRKGFNISGADKWDGSVKDGVTHLRSFTEIVIDPRCIRTIEEMRLYSYKVDQKQLDQHGQPAVLPIIVDKWNHCIDAIRYGLDGYIKRSGAIGVWARLGQNAPTE